MAFLDVETTGLNSKTDRIIEVGIVRVNKDESVEKYSQLVNPGFKISKEIRELTGIKLKELVNAPSFEEVMPKIVELLKVDLLIAHNAKFDYDFIAEECLRLGMSISLPYVDTVKIARMFYPNYITYNLDSIITRLKLTIDNRHRALDDSQILVSLCTRIRNEFGEDELHAAFDKLVVMPKVKQIIENKQATLF